MPNVDNLGQSNPQQVSDIASILAENQAQTAQLANVLNDLQTQIADFTSFRDRVLPFASTRPGVITLNANVLSVLAGPGIQDQFVYKVPATKVWFGAITVRLKVTSAVAGAFSFASTLMEKVPGVQSVLNEASGVIPVGNDAVISSNLSNILLTPNSTITARAEQQGGVGGNTECNVFMVGFESDAGGA